MILEVKSEQKGENEGTTGIETLDVEIQKTDSVGYVLKIRVGDKVMSGEEFRNKYHLASSCFTLQPYNGKLRVTTRGAGHGIGMSQYTANEMAKKKQGYRKILKYFFKGTDIKEVTENYKKCITTSRSGKNMVRGGDEMKKNEKTSMSKRRATVAAVLCFVAAIAIAGTYTFNDYRKTQKNELAKAEEKSRQEETKKDNKENSDLTRETGTSKVKSENTGSSTKKSAADESTVDEKNESDGTGMTDQSEQNGTEPRQQQERVIILILQKTATFYGR